MSNSRRGPHEPRRPHGRKPVFSVASTDYPAQLETTSDKIAADRTAIINHLRTAAAIVEKSGADLPEILSIGVTADEITVQPWLPGAPVQAAQAFEKLMTGPIERLAYPNPLPDGVASGISLISITGAIDGTRVKVTVATYRDTPVDGLLGMTEQAVGALANDEEPHSEPGNDRVLADTLNSPALLPAVEKKESDERDNPGDGTEHGGDSADVADPDPARPGDERPEGTTEG